jgi:hypothetical protein
MPNPPRTPLTCPACGGALQLRYAGEVALDVCDGACGGVWFDNQELGELARTPEGAELGSDIRIDPALSIARRAERRCPRCPAQPLLRHRFSPRSAVHVDSCPKCAGLWLDYGELPALLREARGGAIAPRPAGKVAAEPSLTPATARKLEELIRKLEGRG